MKKISLKELAKFADQYIALNEEKSKILDSDKDLKLLQNKLEKNNIEGAVIQYIPSVNTVLSPLCL